MNVRDFLKDINAQVEEFASSSLKQITKHQRANLKSILDYRAVPSSLMYGEDVLVIGIANRTNLDYFGGFEYVPKESVSVVGNYVFYRNDNSRISDVIDCLIDHEEQEPVDTSE